MVQSLDVICIVGPEDGELTHHIAHGGECQTPRARAVTTTFTYDERI